MYYLKITTDPSYLSCISTRIPYNEDKINILSHTPKRKNEEKQEERIALK